MKQHGNTFRSLKKILLPLMLILALSLTAVCYFSVTANSGPKADQPPDPAFTREEYDKLLALQFDGYENMSVSQYQRRVWQETDTPEYRDLLDRFSQSDVFYQMRDSSPIASFYFYTLDPCTLLRSLWTTDYPQKTVADFNASLDSTPDLFSMVLEAYAQAQSSNAFSPEEEAYEFFTVTLQASLNELYCEKFNEVPGWSIQLSRQERPYPERTPYGETIYAFSFFAWGSLDYTISSPGKLTVAQRDRTLQSFQSRLSAYVDSLCEAEISDQNFKAALIDKADALAAALSTEEMQLSFDLGGMDIMADGENLPTE